MLDMKILLFAFSTLQLLGANDMHNFASSIATQSHASYLLNAHGPEVKSMAVPLASEALVLVWHVSALTTSLIVTI